MIRLFLPFSRVRQATVHKLHAHFRVTHEYLVCIGAVRSDLFDLYVTLYNLALSVPQKVIVNLVLKWMT